MSVTLNKNNKEGDEKIILRHMIYTKGSLEIDDPKT